MSDSNSYGDTYTESQVIMTSVKIIAPFTLTYGMFLSLHGADTPGGSFQGGAIIGVTVLMLAFAFGIESTRQWVKNSLVVGLVAGGVAIFIGTGFATMALGYNFLEFLAFEEAFGIAHYWGMEAIEVGGVALIVAGVIMTLFFTMASGFTPTNHDANHHELGVGEDD
jgi:multicomponent Na+:H+ antiporter subunit B